MFSVIAPPALSAGQRKTINRLTGVVALVWTLAVGSSLGWNIHQEDAKVMELAMAEARANINRDLAFRLWATSRGGLYAAIGKKVQPSPYLAHIPNRDLTAHSGEQLTLMNPAMMLRQMMEEFGDLYGVKARITGLQVLNPANRPDAWEKNALLTFERGARQATTVEQIDGVPYLRVMRPMIMEPGCVKCHAWTKIPVGGIRGATGVSVPLRHYYQIKAREIEYLGLSHGGIWLLGMFSIGFVSLRARRHSGEQEQAQRVLRESEEKVHLLLDSTAEGLIGVDTEGICVLANPASVRLLGYDRAEQLLGRALHPLIHHTHPDGSAYPAHECKTRGGIDAEAGVHVDDEIFWRADGSAFPVEYWSHPMRRDGKVIGTVVAFVDASARRQADESLRKLSRAVEQSPNAVIVTDRAGRIEYVNPKFSEINGYTAAEAIGRNPRLLSSGETAGELYREMWDNLLAGAEWRGEFRNRRKNGELYWCLESISPVKNERGEITHFVGMMEDISERKLAESTIRRLAFYDPLTDLPNRRLMRERLERAIIWSRRGGTQAALLYIDLDRFKTVNDTLGHSVGDALLKAAAIRLAHCVREEDTISRLGGDEFAVVLGNVHGSEEAVAVAEKIIATMQAPFPVDEHEIFITASVGISLYPTDTADMDSLLKNADIALYQAKDQGRNSFQFYSERINTLAMERLELENGLRKAIERGELYLEYQPQLDLKTGAVFGLEALARWRHPVLGQIPPDKFIPLAEETRLIIPIGEWILRTACNQLKAWHDAGRDDLTISVNLSAVQFRQKGLLDTVARVLGEAGIPAAKLELEITESILMGDTGETIATLTGLRSLGVRLSIDDFGTGYSSLGYLKRFPVSTLKIDRTFVRDITVDPDDKAIAEAVIALAKSLKLWVIAEGVETEAQLYILRQLDCDSIQGYFVSRPVLAEHVPALLQKLAQPAS